MKRATVYLKDDTYYLCASSRTTKGFWVASEPFFRIEHGGVGSRSLEALDSSKSGVLGPCNSDNYLDGLVQPILELSEAGSWEDFVKGTKCCHLSLKDGELKAMPTKRIGQEFAHQPKLTVAGSVYAVSDLLDMAFVKCK
ncbi:hypothetical protein [Enterovibrio norvegicus]|uniref:Uncharacterized protein n=1 Tax=Enterovibrio norvegicus TaxID=188144 RepID=A0A2N7LH64_9GAMM|nr:hypothetical protein [Enterovibrio norvegicus]PMN94896.1 hypothetical protein BCT23_02365 [Enterovibrio norvegicus]